MALTTFQLSSFIQDLKLRYVVTNLASSNPAIHVILVVIFNWGIKSIQFPKSRPRPTANELADLTEKETKECSNSRSYKTTEQGSQLNTLTIR